LAQDPTGGDLYVFADRGGSQIKVLYFERSGWAVWAKRLEAGRFITDGSKARTHEIDCTRLKIAARGHRAAPLSQALSTRSEPR
jgi:transposase